MPATCRTVGPAEDHVGVYLRLAIVLGSYSSDEREHLHLLLYQYPFVLLLLDVEVTQHRVAKGPDRGKAGGAQSVVLRKARQLGHKFVVRVEHECEGLLAPFFVYLLGSH